MEMDQAGDSTLEPLDYVIGREVRNGCIERQASDSTLEVLIERHLSSFSSAATADERSAIVARIEAEVRAPNDSNEDTLRFLVRKEGSGSDRVFREATPEEIKLEIHNQIRAMYTETPRDDDVLIYTGESLHYQSHIGKQRLHTFIRSLGRIFPLPAQRRGLVNVPRDVVKLRGNDFLIPFDENRPYDGCIKADDKSIDRMIAQLLE